MCSKAMRLDAMCSDAAIVLQDISKYYEIYARPSLRLLQMLWRGRKRFYEAYWACADINLTIGKGECLGIIGRNGAGKSTLLQLIAGTLAPSGGKRCVNGRLAALLELGSGFNPEFSGRDNVFLNAAILGLSQKEIASRYEAIANFADIGAFLDQPVKTYSSGMALRLAFAVMANVDADILVIDEALAVGDAFFTQKCMRFLREFMASHTVVLVSHDMNAITSLCTRAVLMEAGRISLSGSPQAVARKYLEDLYAAQQGDINLHKRAEPETQETAIPAARIVDMRAELIRNSNLRNDLQIWQFNACESGFGTGACAIADVWFANAKGEKYSWICGGEVVSLHIVCRVYAQVSQPVIGFFVTNAYGQQLFGDNTWLAWQGREPKCEPGDCLHTVFKFQMPVLAPGEYFVTCAIGEGTPEKHVQHHWRHEALAFTAHTSSIASGLVGVPMLAIDMQRQACA